MKSWEIISRKKIFDAPSFLTLYRETVRLENGNVIDDYYTIDLRDFAEIFGMVNSDEVLAIRHYKHGAKRINIGLPSGYIDDGELALSAAKRELLEETGYTADTWLFLGSYVVDGNRGCGHVHVFFATDLIKIQEPDPDDLEIMTVEKISVNRLQEALMRGEVATLGAAIGISLGLLMIKSKLDR
jgi:ADP-ribose pyrophosphatase